MAMRTRSKTTEKPSESHPQSEKGKTRDDNEKNNEAKETASAVMKGARLGFSQALITKLLTFAMNIYLVRLSTFSTLGSVYDLEFYYGALLYLSREMVRMAITRNLGCGDLVSKKGKTKLLVNMGYIPLLVSIPILALICTYLYSTASTTNADALAFSYPFWIYVGSALLELLAEPAFVLLQANLLFEQRVHVESAGFIVQTALKLALLTRLNLASPSTNREKDVIESILCYAYAQLGYSVTMSFGYWAAFARTTVRQAITGQDVSFISVFTPSPVKLEKSRIWFDAYLLEITRSFGTQTILKYFLSMGDRIGMARLGLDAHQKGVYAVVSDLGGLVVRIVFVPLEEMSRSLFSRNLTNRSRNSSLLIISCFIIVYKFQIFFGSLFLFWGSNYTSTILKLYRKASPEAILVLSVYCAYIPVMGVNGISEGFVQAVGDGAALAYQSYFMVIVWALYFVLLYGLCVLLHMGTEAIVLCNIITMILRIMFNFWFIRAFIQKQPISETEKEDALKRISVFQLLPQSALVGIFWFVSWGLSKYDVVLIGRLPISLSDTRREILHIGIGVVSMLTTLILIYRTERTRFIPRIRHYTSLMKK